MNKHLFVGLDTSNYTTSLAVLDQNGNRLLDRRIPLRVKAGERGLRQQEAVFQHIRNLSALVDEMEEDMGNIHTVISSVKPRMLKDSYMPVFEVSKNVGTFLAGMTGSKWMATSHQRGHLRVALEGIEKKDLRFVAFHVSGGTTEMLSGTFDGEKLTEFPLGGTSDISAGQLIDRIGVRMGFPFPAGKTMDEQLMDSRMKSYEKTYAFKGSFKEGVMNLSGLENHLTARLEKGDPVDHVAYATFRNIAETLEKAAIYYAEKTKVNHILMTGGVSANRFIRSHMSDVLTREGLEIVFCKREDCTDNAVGVALIGLDHYTRSEL